MYSAAISISHNIDSKRVFDMLCPGSHYVVITTPLKYSRMACEAEDNGFEIRDQIIWLSDVTQHNILLARKPLEGLLAENILKYNCGGINIDDCKIGNEERINKPFGRKSWRKMNERELSEADQLDNEKKNVVGRWPANIIHCGSENIMNEFLKYGITKSGVDKGERGKGGMWNKGTKIPCGPQYGDSGSVARYFKEIKTIEELKDYLITLILPPDGKLLIV